MENKTIDESSNRWGNKALMYAFAGLLVGSNILNAFVNQQAYNTEKIELNEETNRRRIKNAVKELNYQITIKDLNKELKDCEIK